MALPAPTYDLTLLLDTSADADRRKKIVADAEALIGRLGTHVGTHDWGTRATAYEVRKQTDAEYKLVQFQGPRELIEELDRVLSITDGLLRYRIIRLAPGTGDVPDLKSEPAVVPQADEAAPAAS